MINIAPSKPINEDLRQIVSTRLPTRWGEFRMLGFERHRPFHVGLRGGQVETALAIVMGDLNDVVEAPLMRIHSQCFTGESLGSLRCDCRDQLEIALQMIADDGRGIVIYEYKEGRGIGLMAKLQTYALQDAGLDTVDANRALGFEADCRDFSLPAAILHHLCVHRVRLLTNNPRKSCALIEAGIQVVAQVPCEAAPNPHSLAYLRAKKRRMGHALSLESHEHQHNGTGYAGDAEQIAAAIDPGARVDDRFEFASVDDAITEIQAGRMIVVVDDEDRENEGDLTIAAEMITPEAINFMATHARGLICVAMTGERLDEMDLSSMSPDGDNTALHGTAFTVSIDLKGHGCTTGISAHDRAGTIRAAVDPTSAPEDFARPGHVFPLRARSGGVLERRGQTEAAVDLTRLAGLNPAGVICEIMNEDGSMARVPDLIRFCKKHGLLMVSVAALAQYRLQCHAEESLATTDRRLSLCA